MTHGRYVVTGQRQYRGHSKGTIFEARLDPNAEQRAIARGDIVLLDRVNTTIADTTYRLPQDWPPPAADATATRGAERRLSH